MSTWENKPRLQDFWRLKKGNSTNKTQWRPEMYKAKINIYNLQVWIPLQYPYIYILPVVPHKAVAEVSRRGKL